MTNPPRYASNRPGDRPDPSQPVGQDNPVDHGYIPSHLRYDYRHIQQPSKSTYDPYHAAHQPITEPIPRLRPKGSRRGAVVAGAAVAAVVGGGLGAATMGAVVLAHDTTPTKPPINQPAAPPQSAAKAPAGRGDPV